MRMISRPAEEYVIKVAVHSVLDTGAGLQLISAHANWPAPGYMKHI